MISNSGLIEDVILLGELYLPENYIIYNKLNNIIINKVYNKIVKSLKITEENE